MSDGAREALNRLEAASADGRLGALCAEHRIALCVVFGSALDSTTTPADLDVAVRFEPLTKGSPDLLRLLDDLYELIDSEHVDVMVLDRAGPVAREQGRWRASRPW